MKRLFTLLLLLFELCLYGANTQIDSLENILQSNVSLSSGQKCDVLILLSKKYLRVSPQKSVDYGKAALELANLIEDDLRIASALKNIGSAYYVQSDFVQGLDFFKQALKINIEINNRQEIAACYNNLGLIYNNLGYYQEALKNHLSQLKINEEDNNLKGNCDFEAQHWQYLQQPEGKRQSHRLLHQRP
jgi:tetratricopeptide (TPR) repeat protein